MKREDFIFHHGTCKWCNREKQIKNWTLPNLEIGKDFCEECSFKVSQTIPNYFGLEISCVSAGEIKNSNVDASD